MNNVQKQEDSSDCGLYAIADATALLFNQDPSTLFFNQSTMRDPLPYLPVYRSHRVISRTPQIWTQKKKLLEYKSHAFKRFVRASSIDRVYALPFAMRTRADVRTYGRIGRTWHALLARSVNLTRCNLLVLGNALSSAFFFRQSRTNFSLTLCSRPALLFPDCSAVSITRSLKPAV